MPPRNDIDAILSAIITAAAMLEVYAVNAAAQQSKTYAFKPSKH